jgi:uncharacterized protein YcbK (DUF882 family)
VPVGKTRLKIPRFVAARAGYSCGLALLLFLFGSKALQNAVAEGETRTISLHHVHTDEDITITYKRDGRYDDAAMEKLNWFLRDWRRGETTHMDPHLIDLVWEVHREVDSKDPIWVVCGYRSPETNAMLRHRSRGVARFSQHMLGKAMDFYIPGAPLEELRVIGLRLQRGGVGFYPTSGSPFVHMDTGGVRMWPRMTREELVRVFPDGRTVHIPTDGRPLSGYALALADIRQRGSDPSENSIEAARNAGVDVGTVVASNEPRRVNLFAKLLGLAKDDDDEDADSSTAESAPAGPQLKPTLVAAIERKAENTASAAARVAKAAETKLVHTATLAHITRAEAAQPPAPRPNADPNRVAAQTPSEIINARGYWRSIPDDAVAAKLPVRAVNPLSTAPAPRGTQVASADPATTGTVNSWSRASDDRVPPELALAYAEQPERLAPSVASPAMPAVAIAARAVVPQESLPTPQLGTTIAVKRTGDQTASTILTATAKMASVIKAGAQFDNPWLRAMVLSPSVQRFLTTVAIGERDFRSLAPFMVKPASSVMMTFSADPNIGLVHDHFSGSAIVFVSTVSYPTHTASLQ